MQERPRVPEGFQFQSDDFSRWLPGAAVAELVHETGATVQTHHIRGWRTKREDSEQECTYIKIQFVTGDDLVCDNECYGI